MVGLCLSFILAAQGIDVSDPVKGPDGILRYTVMSPYQAAPTVLEVLLPDEPKPEDRFPALYILPVNDGIDGPWGNGVQEARRHNVHNKHRVICVSPEYDFTPWYGDHPTDPALRQEGYLLQVVIPAVEARHPVVAGKDGRLLIGFSKSGFGALTVLLRHLDVIGKAAVWDAPLTSPRILPGEEHMLRVFVTDENYTAYYIPGLIDEHAKVLRANPDRIVLGNNGGMSKDVRAVHEQLDSLSITHAYLEDDRREHDWRSGWFPIVAARLFPAR
ncbi:MAG: hypothetical protein AMXMBFR84_32690 [Candidatus Hydrogenedentota bacterium]